MEIKFIPKAPAAAAAGNQDSSLQELPVLRLKRAKKMKAAWEAPGPG